MRKWLYESVVSSPSQDEFSGGRVLSSGGVEGDEGQGDSPSRPFIVLRLSTNQQITRLPGATIRQQFVQVWLHTEPGSMIPTDDLCEELSKHLPAQAPAKREDEVIIECDWRDTSSDGFDDHYQTATRFVTFLVTYKTAA